MSGTVHEGMLKTRVLFVDDEPLILQGLQRMLRPMRAEWEMAFVESGPRAVELMRETPFQVVVSDMRMPGMDGAQFLSEVKRLFPQTVRLILSGHADKNLILQCVGTAHQFMAKPCDPEILRSAIRRVSAFDSSLKNDRMKELVARMDCLPSMPALMNDIIQELQKDDCSLDSVGALISRDIAITAKLLKLVNSAFFGLRRQISSPEEAVSYLGLETIKSLVLAVNAFSTFEGRGTGPISIEGLWAHSLEVAGSARNIAAAADAPRAVADQSFIAGLLHDIGKLALAANLPEEYGQAVAAANKDKGRLRAAEEAAFGADHAAIGGYLLSLWGLPSGVVDAISFHHEPLAAGTQEFTPLAAIHLADAFAHERDTASAGAPGFLNEEFVKALGLTGKIQLWKDLPKC